MNSHTLSELEARNVDRLCGFSIPDKPTFRTPMQAKLAETWGAGDKPVWSAGRCKLCAREIDATPHKLDLGFGALDVPVTVCQDCQPLVDDDYNIDRKGLKTISMTPVWDEECPVRFLEVIESGNYPAHVDREAMRRCLSFSPGEAKGLALMGPSGSGKTTTLWALFRQLERAGSNPKFLTGVELGRALSKAARDLDAVEWLFRCRILIIDDLGKERATPAASALLWEVMDRRYQNKLPVILSTRFAGSEIRDRFGEPQLGADIARRLNELCRKVEFRLLT